MPTRCIVAKRPPDGSVAGKAWCTVAASVSTTNSKGLHQLKALKLETSLNKHQIAAGKPEPKWSNGMVSRSKVGPDSISQSTMLGYSGLKSRCPSCFGLTWATIGKDNTELVDGLF
eukprot:389613-Amphidinium_carterae.2